MRYFKKIPGCTSVTGDDVQQWIASNDKLQELIDADDIAVPEAHNTGECADEQ